MNDDRLASLLRQHDPAAGKALTDFDRTRILHRALRAAEATARRDRSVRLRRADALRHCDRHAPARAPCRAARAGTSDPVRHAGRHAHRLDARSELSHVRHANETMASSHPVTGRRAAPCGRKRGDRSHSWPPVNSSSSGHTQLFQIVLVRGAISGPEERSESRRTPRRRSATSTTSSRSRATRCSTRGWFVSMTAERSGSTASRRSNTTCASPGNRVGEQADSVGLRRRPGAHPDWDTARERGCARGRSSDHRHLVHDRRRRDDRRRLIEARRRRGARRPLHRTSESVRTRRPSPGHLASSVNRHPS